MAEPETTQPNPFADKNGQETYASLKQASAVKGIPPAILGAAKNLGCPGFQATGRIVWSPDLERWLADTRPACDEEASNNKEHWSREKLKWDAKRSELQYSEAL